MSVSLWIGIDGGATKTRTVAVGVDGVTVGQGLTGATNYQVVGVDVARRNLRHAIVQVLADVDEDPHLVNLVAGFAGLDGPSDVATVAEMMRNATQDLPNRRWWAVNDTVAAWAGAMAAEPGAIVISGSGAAALAVGENGLCYHADGWGHWLGDEGSGFDIGRQGLRAALRAVDQRGPATELTDRLMSRQATAANGWASWVTSLNALTSDDVHPQIAAFALDVVESATAGDGVALEILGRAAQALAHTAASVLRQAHLSSPQVATVGSLFVHSQILYDEFGQRVQQLVPGVLVNRPKLQPAEGAALLAKQPSLIPRDVLTVTGT